jgi:hypothetical protein
MAREEHTDARTHNISKKPGKEGYIFPRKKKSKDHYKYKSPPLLCLSPSQSSIALSAQTKQQVPGTTKSARIAQASAQGRATRIIRQQKKQR